MTFSELLERSVARAGNPICFGMDPVLSRMPAASTPEETIRSFHVDKAIISCTGLDMHGQFTEAGIENANIKQAMMASARETILAMDSHKFDKTAFLSVGTVRQVSAVVTNTDPGPQWREFLDEQHVRLVCGGNT